MFVTVIIPIHSNSFVKNSIDNFNRQNYFNKELLFLLNGEITEKIDYPCEQIFVSGNIGSIRNSGLNWMKENNRKVFSFFDADDWYGSDYLSEAISKLQEWYDIVGKSNFCFRYNEDVYRISGSNFCGNIYGPTITGYLSEKRYPEIQRYEEIEFIQSHSKIGKTNNIENYIYEIRENGLVGTSFKYRYENIKYWNTLNGQTDCKIYKNDILDWKYGDGFDFNILFNRT